MNWKLWRKAAPTPIAPPSERAKPLALDIDPWALAVARAAGKGLERGRAFAEMFPPAPVPDWVPKAADIRIAQDDALSPVYNYVGGYEMFGEGIVWPGFAYLAELTQRPEYRTITETRAKEMTRKWIKLTYKGDDPDTDRLEGLERAFERFRIRDVFRLAAEHDGFFGRAQIYIDTGRVGAALQRPLIDSPETIAKGSIKGFRCIEPLWSYPGIYNSINPLAADYFVPSIWYVMNQTVHHTRLMTMVSAPVPDILKAAYSFAGVSLSQRAKPYVDNWLRTRQSVSDLLHSFSTTILKTLMQSQLQGGGWNNLFNRIDIFNATRDNRGCMVIDKETEDMMQLNAPISGLSDLQAQAQEQMASVAQIPLVKLLGISPAGLNSTSDGEIRVFYDSIHALQEHIFGEHLLRILNILQLNEFGDIDENVGFKFEALWQMDDAAKASIRKTNADTDVVLIEAGVLAPEDSRKRVSEDDESPYAGLDPDDLPEPLDDDGNKLTGINKNADPAKTAEPENYERSGV